MQKKHKRKLSPRFTKRHGLSLVVALILLLWIVLYSISNEQKHWGSFFGNAIADWSGVLVTVLATKRLYEKGSGESKPEPSPELSSRVLEKLRQHSLTIFLLITGQYGWPCLLTQIRRGSGDKWWATLFPNGPRSLGWFLLQRNSSRPDQKRAGKGSDPIYF